MSKTLYDYSTIESREHTAKTLYRRAVSERAEVTERFRLYEDYYAGRHAAQKELAGLLEQAGLPWTPAVLQDPYIQVESQVDPEIPTFEFAGRDDDFDSYRARQREYTVKYILERNRLIDSNTRNERRLGKLGNAFWKAYWDESVTSDGGATQGDIVIQDVDPGSIYPDPSALRLQDCEYLCYSYRLHRGRAMRQFGTQIRRRGLTPEELFAPAGSGEPSAWESPQQEDTIEVLEFWFRQPEDGSDRQEFLLEGDSTALTVDYKAGDVACVVLLGGREVQYIPRYWVRTGAQNQSYPFVHYYKIADEHSFWGRSELESLIPLVDAADRELAYAQLNAAFTASDILLVEENALAEGSALSNAPGAVITLRPGMLGAVRRLGGINGEAGRLNNVAALQDQISRVAGNFDAAMGQEPTRVTTASGIAQLNERADARRAIKRADRLSGFERLFELLDWLALEFYDDGRMIFLGAPEAEHPTVLPEQYENLDPAQGAVFFRFQSSRFLRRQEDRSYFPRVDTVIRAGDGVRRSRAYTLSVLENLMNVAVTQENYRLMISMLSVLDLPQSQDLIRSLRDRFEPSQPPVLASDQLPPPTPDQLGIPMEDE